MNPISMTLLASVFTWAGALVGAPSAVALVLCGLYRAFAAGARTASTDFGSNPDAILLMLKGMVTAVGFVARIAGAAAQFIVNALLIGSVAGLLFAALCWLTGRGLASQALWARFSAGAVLGLLLLPSLLLALSAGSGIRLPMLALAAFCALALHAVWAGYTPPAP